MARAVQVGAKSYPSRAAAARGEGVSVCTIHRHLREFGTLDRLHEAPAAPVNRVACILAGRSWPSVTALARHLRVSKGYVSRCYARGNVAALEARLRAVEGVA